MFRPLGGHLQVELRNIFLHHFFFAVLFFIYISDPLNFTSELRRMEHNLLVLSVRKIIIISYLWPRCMWLVLIVGLGGIVLCVLYCLLLFFVFLLVSSLGIRVVRTKGKGKVFPLMARCGPEGGYRYTSTLP